MARVCANPGLWQVDFVLDSLTENASVNGLASTFRADPTHGALPTPCTFN